MLQFVLPLECVRRLEEITGKNIPFYKVDLLETDALREIFRKVRFPVCFFQITLVWLLPHQICS